MSKLTFMVFTLCILIGFAKCDFRPPKYVVNLNDPPLKRWVAIASKYKEFVPEVMNITRAIVPKGMEKVLFYVAQKFERFFSPEIADELRGIANGSGLPLGDVVLLNLLYDLTAFDRPDNKNRACTSIIAQNSNGEIYHGRNLDYPLKSLLNRTTMIVEFKRHDQRMFQCITFAFYAGIMTGQRAGGFTISVNERDKGPWWYNLLMAIFTEMRYPVGFAVREVMQYNETFLAAVNQLRDIRLMAPCYLIISGKKPGEGVVLTRDRLSTADSWYLTPFQNQWYLLETNYDHWEGAGDKRRHVAQQALNETGPDAIDERKLFAILSKKPVLNDITVYTTVMSASHPVYFSTYTFVRDGNKTDCDVFC